MKKFFKTVLTLIFVAGITACSSDKGSKSSSSDSDSDSKSKESTGTKANGEADQVDDFNFTIPLTVEAEIGELSKYVTFDQQIPIVVSTEKGDTVFTVTVASSIAMTVNEPFASNNELSFKAELLDENHILIGEEFEFVKFDAPYNFGTGYTLQPGTIRAQYKKEGPIPVSKKEDFLEIVQKIKKAKYILLKPDVYGSVTYTSLNPVKEDRDNSQNTSSNNSPINPVYEQPYIVNYKQSYIVKRGEIASNDTTPLSTFPKDSTYNKEF